MPYLSRRILVSLCPFVNLDLFKKGHYHVACHLVDDQAGQLHSKVSCVEIRDLIGPNLSEYAYPGSCIVDDYFITQTMRIEYTEQSFLLGECCVFHSYMPLQGDYTEAYLPSRFTLQFDLMFSGAEEMPDKPTEFTKVSRRNVSMNIDWRKGLHDHFPVVFDYFHMAAFGLTVHASLHEVCLEEYIIERPPPVQTRRWFFQSQTATPPEFPNLATILFGEPHTESNGRPNQYEVPTAKIQRAQDAHQMLCDVLRSAQDSLYIGHTIMSGERSPTRPCPDVGDLTAATTLEEAEEMCKEQISKLNSSLALTWEWFRNSSIVHPEMINFLATRSHSIKLAYMKETVVSYEHPNFKNITNITDPICQAAECSKIRRTLQIPLPLYCSENVENQMNSSVVFIEPCPWETLSEGRSSVQSVPSHSFQMENIASGSYGFLREVQPYFLTNFPHSNRRRKPGVHLVICIHGLQGNQFDLRLYRVYLLLALPQVRFDFLMAQANHIDTFCDFNLMTDRLVEEILEYVREMPTPPSKVSFIGHSLGNIVVRSLVTRPELSSLQPKLHLFLSICGPHLGTQYQNGIVSMGMWAVRKWYNSQSLLQLSLKDSPNPRDAFLYHLSEAPNFEYFRHVVLLTSPQDKYVPYQSAKVASVAQDGSLQSKLGLEMMQNILEPLREAKVNLVRVSVDHNIPTSANSVIGRAAHISMLDNDRFIEKFVTLHLAQYFLES